MEATDVELSSQIYLVSVAYSSAVRFEGLTVACPVFPSSRSSALSLADPVLRRVHLLVAGAHLVDDARLPRQRGRHRGALLRHRREFCGSGPSGSRSESEHLSSLCLAEKNIWPQIELILAPCVLQPVATFRQATYLSAGSSLAPLISNAESVHPDGAPAAAHRLRAQVSHQQSRGRDAGWRRRHPRLQCAGALLRAHGPTRQRQRLGGVPHPRGRQVLSGLKRKHKKEHLLPAPCKGNRQVLSVMF